MSWVRTRVFRSMISGPRWALSGIERPGTEQAHPSQNGGERRAELVGQGREEFVLGAVRVVQPAT